MAPKRNLRSGVVLAAIIASLSLIVPREAAATGGISGRIAGPNGEPLAGVEVQAFVGRPFLTPWSRDMFLGFPFRTGPVAWTQTGADGRYELTGLEPTLEPSCDANNGWYMLVVSPSPQTGFTPRVLPGNITGLPARPLVVEEGKTLTGIDIRLGPPGRIAGTVTGPDGAPLADTWVGADIQTSSFRPEWLPRRATTDGLGRFVLTGLEDDAYFVKVTPPGTSMWDLYYPGASDPVPIRPILGEVTGGNDITVPTPGLLEVNSENYTAWSFTSGPEEYYLSPKYLPPGDYRIGVAMSQDLMDNTYYPSTFQWEDASPVAIKPGEITSVTMSQTPLGTAHGKVVDGAGAPVGGVDVNVSTACGTTHKARTNSFGDFSVSSSGDRKLQFSKQGYSTTWLDGKPDETSADVVRFRSGETVTLPTVVLQSLGTPGSIAGRVTAVGAPFKGFVEVWTARDAAVALRDPAGASPLRTGLTNPDGSYEVTALSPGSYLLLFEGSTFGARWYPAAVSPWTATPVVVEAGLQTTGIDADLALTGSISGTVTLDHQPLPTVAKVCLTDVAGHMLRCVSGTIDNTYSFDGVAPGTYLLAFDSDQSFSWGKWYPFEDTMATAVPIVVGSGQAVTGINADFPPLGRIEAQISRTHSTWDGDLAIIDGDTDAVRAYWSDLPVGPFSFQLPPGRYRFLFSTTKTYYDRYYPQWWPGKTLASEAGIIEVLPGQTVSGIDVVLEDYRYNRPPALTQPPEITATEGMESFLTLAATDPDGDLLTFGAENLPLGAAFAPYSGEFRWAPTCTQAGTYPAIRFTVTDHGDPPLSAEVTVPVSVAARDCAPVLDPIGGKSVIAGETLTFQITASNPEGGALVLEAADLPSGATFAPADGTFTWTPSVAQVGSYTVTFAAYATGAPTLRDSEAVTIAVVPRNPPVLDPIGSRSVIVGELLNFTVTGADPLGDPVVLEAVGLPPGATFNPADGIFSWTPSAAQGGVYTVTFAVVSTLDSSLRDEDAVTISAFGPLLFSDDFEHSDGADPDWVRLSGFWVVRNHTLRSSPTGIAIAVPGPTDRAGANFIAGRIVAQVILRPLPSGTPNVALLFGYRDPQHYRYVRFFPSATEIGQVGTIDGQSPPLRRQLTHALPVGLPQFVRIDVRPGGTVQVFAGGVPLGALTFPAAVAGHAGVMTRNAQAVVDNFRLWTRTILN